MLWNLTFFLKEDGKLNQSEEGKGGVIRSPCLDPPHSMYPDLLLLHWQLLNWDQSTVVQIHKVHVGFQNDFAHLVLSVVETSIT